MASTESTTCSAGAGASATSERLELLVPIAVVIAAGCEPCAERMVARALDGGCPRRDVRKTLGIAGDMRGRDCLTKAVGAETLRRMDAPLARGRRTLAAWSEREGRGLGGNP